MQQAQRDLALQCMLQPGQILLVATNPRLLSLARAGPYDEYKLKVAGAARESCCPTCDDEQPPRCVQDLLQPQQVGGVPDQVHDRHLAVHLRQAQ